MPEVTLSLADCPGTFIPLLGAPRLSLPLDQVRVSAGFPSPAADYEDKRLDINEYLVRNPVSTFFFAVEGNSMEGAEIFAGDILVVDKSIRPRDGHIFIALILHSQVSARQQSWALIGPFIALTRCFIWLAI